jgi:predicted nuclease of predicted toxin-antitoxin system
LIRLLLDQGLPRSAVAVLQKVGWDVVHTFEVGLSRAADVELLEVARRESRTVVTLDADFHALLAVANANSPSVIRIRLEGLRGENLAELLISIWPKISRQVEKGALVTVTESALRIRSLPINQNTD